MQESFTVIQFEKKRKIYGHKLHNSIGLTPVCDRIRYRCSCLANALLLQFKEEIARRIKTRIDDILAESFAVQVVHTGIHFYIKVYTLESFVQSLSRATRGFFSEIFSFLRMLLRELCTQLQKLGEAKQANLFKVLNSIHQEKKIAFKNRRPSRGFKKVFDLK